MARKTTIPLFRRGLLKMAKDMPKFLVPPLRDSIKELKVRVRKDIKGTDLGRSIWTARRKNREYKLKPRLKTLRSRFSRSKIAWVGGLAMGGFGAIQEEGGKTAAHTIQPRRAKMLAFEKGGKLILAKRVDHPGSRIRRVPIMIPAFEKKAPRIANRLGDALQRLAEGSLR